MCKEPDSKNAEWYPIIKGLPCLICANCDKTCTSLRASADSCFDKQETSIFLMTYLPDGTVVVLERSLVLEDAVFGLRSTRSATPNAPLPICLITLNRFMGESGIGESGM